MRHSKEETKYSSKQIWTYALRENIRMLYFMEGRLRKLLSEKVTYKMKWKDEVEAIMEKASQKEVQTKEMKDLTWEVREIGGGEFNDLI